MDIIFLNEDWWMPKLPGDQRVKLATTGLEIEVPAGTVDDIPLTMKIWDQTLNFSNDQSIGGDDPGLEFDKHLERVGPDSIWLAEVEGDVIGFTSLIIKDQEAEIEPVIAPHKHRGKGIGERLIQYAIEEAKKLKILCLYVKPVARNKEAISFFFDCGFRTIGHI